MINNEYEEGYRQVLGFYIDFKSSL